MFSKSRLIKISRNTALILTMAASTTAYSFSECLDVLSKGQEQIELLQLRTKSLEIRPLISTKEKKSL